MPLDDDPKIAVLLAAYNGLEWLPEQVKTILDQNDVSVSLFVSVDSSSDGTEKWFDELARRDPRITILPHGRKFGGAARNFFRLITDTDLDDCDYVSFADQDDLWFKNKLSRAVHFLCLKECDGYSSNVIAFWPSGRKHLVHKAQSQKKWDYLFEAAGPGCTYVLRRSLLELIRKKGLIDINLIDDVYLHDWFCYAFARANNKLWYIDPEPSLLYRQHASNQVGVNSGIKGYLGRLSQFSDGFWLQQGALIARVIGVWNTEFVNRWRDLKPLGLFRLAISARICRRRFRDQVAFFTFCIILAVRKSFNRDED
jgi:rhamnosyltransferase